MFTDLNALFDMFSGRSSSSICAVLHFCPCAQAQHIQAGEEIKKGSSRGERAQYGPENVRDDVETELGGRVSSYYVYIMHIYPPH